MAESSAGVKRRVDGIENDRLRDVQKINSVTNDKDETCPAFPRRMLGKRQSFHPMKNPSKLLLPLAGIMWLGTGFLRAEEPAVPPPPPPPAEHHAHRGEMRGDIGKMAQELNLTAEQKIQIEAIRKQTRESMKAVRSDSTLSDDQKREKNRDLIKSEMEQIRSLLTPEQQAKAKTLRGKRGHRGPDDGPPPPPPGEETPPPPPPAPAK